MIALDTTALSGLLIPGAKMCRAGTNVPIKHGKERLEALVERISKDHDSILIPTPVLSELLVCLSQDKIADLLTQLNASAWFRVEAFDSAAAVELGIRTAKAIAAGDKREGAPADTPWTKVKFDRQIVAIAYVNGASEIVSDDPHVKAIGDRWGIKVTSVEDLPIPSELIPPPLFAGLECEPAVKRPDPISVDVQGSGDGHAEKSARSQATQEEAVTAPLSPAALAENGETEKSTPGSGL